ncbi:PBSX family phage terminase large subunit [Hymenobacter cellulosivorans]|uniref:Terminase large subunit n=1 Tax=Hymenobacter cellulosivorans TaxID=2932249 RepID=A0ABY4FAE1_9BACT|nr:terminase large subunit [Hymenobacter cellulosivorans]UOQ53067.1 terminase large subunit [Hymenobacter cellulosivorans]
MESTAEVVVNQGGTWSAKTYTILQTLFAKLADDKRAVATVCGQDIPNLKAGAIRDANEIYHNSPELQRLIKTYNKSDHTFTFHNGCVMEFKSYDSPQDAKSGKRKYLFVNEANGIPYGVFEELYMRTEQSFIDYNPNGEFWVHDNLIGRPNVETLISYHIHNPFVKPKQRAKIEALKEKDLELWKVYARGLTGKIEGLVLRNWTVVEEVPPGYRFLGRGLDFGFTNDPTTAVDLYLGGGQLWADEVLYKEGLTNPDIHRELLVADPSATLKVVVADSAEQKSIEELRRLGFRLIEPATKGPGSVNAGLDLLRSYHLNVTRRSVMLRKELSNYKWKVDRLTGRPTNEPVDAFNHCIDAMRYVALNKLPAALAPRRRSAPSSIVR